MSGRHEAPLIGSAAREATASPYIGKRRVRMDYCPPPLDRLCGCRQCQAEWAAREAELREAFDG